MEISIEELKAPTASGPTTLVQNSESVDVNGPWKIGENYLIRTVTMTLTGRLTAVYPNELVLDDAAWIADSGRWSDAVSKGSFGEVEPFSGPVIVGRGALIDATVVGFAVPRERK